MHARLLNRLPGGWPARLHPPCGWLGWPPSRARMPGLPCLLPLDRLATALRPVNRASHRPIPSHQSPLRWTAVGVLDPWFVVFKWNPQLWYKVTREIVTLERMHRAFDTGLMEYGLMRGVKAAKVGGGAAAGEQQQPAAAAGAPA